MIPYKYISIFLALLALCFSILAIMFSLIYSPNKNEDKPTSKSYNPGSKFIYANFTYNTSTKINSYLDISTTPNLISQTNENINGVISIENNYFTYIGENESIILQFEGVVNTNNSDYFIRPLVNNEIISFYTTKIIKSGANMINGVINLKQNDTLRFGMYDLNNNFVTNFAINKGTFYRIYSINNTHY